MCGLIHLHHKLRAEDAKYQPQVTVSLITNKTCVALALKKAGLGPFPIGCPGLPWLLFPPRLQDALFYNSLCLTLKVCIFLICM